MLLCYSCPSFSPFSLLCSSHHLLPQSIPHCCHVHASFTLVLLLVPSPSSHYYPHLPSPLVTVSLFLVSMPLVLFCSLVYFVHQVPLIGEIIWYLSFTDQLISLSIIFSSSIHAVEKGRSSFFSFSCIVFHCVNVPQSF